MRESGVQLSVANGNCAHVMTNQIITSDLHKFNTTPRNYVTTLDEGDHASEHRCALSLGWAGRHICRKCLRQIHRCRGRLRRLGTVDDAAPVRHIGRSLLISGALEL